MKIRDLKNGNGNGTHVWMSKVECEKVRKAPYGRSNFWLLKRAFLLFVISFSEPFWPTTPGIFPVSCSDLIISSFAKMYLSFCICANNGVTTKAVVSQQHYFWPCFIVASGLEKRRRPLNELRFLTNFLIGSFTKEEVAPESHMTLSLSLSMQYTALDLLYSLQL